VVPGTGNAVTQKAKPGFADGLTDAEVTSSCTVSRTTRQKNIYTSWVEELGSMTGPSTTGTGLMERAVSSH